MATAMAELARSGFRPRADLILAVSCGEEAGGAPGARMMVATGVLTGASMLVVGEPTGLELCPAQKGIQLWNITAQGRACHSSTPHLGVSAISFIAHLIPELEENPFPYTAHPLLGRPTVNVTTVEGGSAPNIIPDRCTITALMRTVPGQDLDQNTEILHETLRRVAAERGLPVGTEVTWRGVPALETAPGDPFLVAVRKAVAEARGSEPGLLPFTGATEAAVLAPAHGMLSVIFGPGHLAQAHEPNEYVEIEELETAARGYRLIAERVLA